MKYILSLMALVVLMATSCITKKVSTSTERETTDSTYVSHLERERDSLYEYMSQMDSTYVKVIQPQDQSVVLDYPCDSVTGKLKEISLTVGKTTVSTKGNKLVVETKCDECESRFERSERQWIQERALLREKNDSTTKFYSSHIAEASKVVKRDWSWNSFLVGVAALAILLLIIYFTFRK